MKHSYRKKLTLLFLSLSISAMAFAQSPFEPDPSDKSEKALSNQPAGQQRKIPVSAQASPVLQPDTLLFPGSAEPEGKVLSEEERNRVMKLVNESKPYDVDQVVNGRKGQGIQDSTGTSLHTFRKSARLNARNLFEEEKQAFPLAKADQMLLKSTSTKYNRNLATYQQTHHAIPVEGAIYKVRESGDKIEAFGYIAEGLAIDGQTSISAEKALSIALAKINAQKYVWESKKFASLVHQDFSKKPTGQLVYVGPNFSPRLSTYHLAWKFDILALLPQSSHTIYVDAKSGEIILDLDLQNDTQQIGNGKSRYSGNVSFNTEQYADGFKLEAVQGKYAVPVITLNMNHEDYATDESVTEFVDEDNNWNDLYNESRDEAAIDIHWGMQRTLDYYAEKFDRNGYDNAGSPLFGLAHWGKDFENAAWTGGWAQFGDGNNTPYVGLGITAHELTHAVTQYSASLIYQGESGALNESFSDIFGVSVEFYVGNESNEEIWQLGDELYSHGAMRSFSDPKSQGQPDTYQGEYWIDPSSGYDNGGVHINSGVSNYWYYLLVQGGEGINDNGDTYSVQPIGLEKAEKIAYLTLTEYLSPSSDFEAMRIATLMITEDLYGLGSEDYIQVSNAWFAVGLGAAYTDRAMELVSYKAPESLCGPLTGNEPFFITIRNTGTQPIKAFEKINYKLRLYLVLGSRIIELYEHDGQTALADDLEVGQVATVAVQDQIPYYNSSSYLNYVEIKLDMKPIEDFGISEGISFATALSIPEETGEGDLMISAVSLPETDGAPFPSGYVPQVTLQNNGCTTLPKGTTIKVGYKLGTGNEEPIWKTIALEQDLAGNATYTVSFDKPIDLSAAELCTLTGYVDYEDDPKEINNVYTDAVYALPISKFPYIENFDATPGGWRSVSINTDQSWYWQPYTFDFRGEACVNLWGTAKFDDPALSKVQASADFALQSPVFDFAKVALPYMEFDMAWLFTNEYDGLIVEYSEDFGKTWTKELNVDYNSNFSQNPATDGPWFSSTNTVRTKAPLKAYFPELKGKKGMIRFRVLMDEFPDNRLGAMVDNIKVGETPYDLKIENASLDVGTCELDNSNAKLSFDVINSFITDQENVQVSAIVRDRNGKEVTSLKENITLTFTKLYDTVHVDFGNALNLQVSGEIETEILLEPLNNKKDSIPANNTYILKSDIWSKEASVVSSLPYLMDFEGDRGYEGWKTFENKEAIGWQIGDAKSLGTAEWFLLDHTTFMAINDTKCGDCDSKEALLMSPRFDLSNYTAAYLSFDGDGENFGYSDSFVKISIDGGVSWDTVFQVPYENAWRSYHVDISKYTGNPCVFIAFTYTDNGHRAGGFAVDNIKIKENSTEVSVSNLIVPQNIYGTSEDHQFYFNANNLGFAPIESILLHYTFKQNGKEIGTPIEVRKQVDLQQNQSKVVILDSIPALGKGIYEVEITASLTEGVFETSKALKGTFEVKGTTPTLQSIDFSGLDQGPVMGTDGWISNEDDRNSFWKLLTTAENSYLSIPKYDHTGDESAQLLYNQLEYDSYYGEMVSSFFVVPEATTLEFFYAMQSNSLCALLVDVKQPGGEWTNIWTLERRAAIDREWQKGVVNFKDYAGKNVMLRFRHAKAGGYSYMELDDVSVNADKLVDVAMKIISPRDVCGSGDEFILELTNEGSTPILPASMEVNLEYINTGEVITETIPNGIEVGKSISYTLKNSPSLQENGDSHIFNVAIQLEGDSVSVNNVTSNYVYQETPDEFSIFDQPILPVYAGEATYLDAETNIIANELRVDSYEWNTGETSPGIYVSSPGEYSVTVKFRNGCERTENITIESVEFTNGLVSGSICGPEVLLSPGEYASYIWSDGSTEASYTATKSGRYYVTVYDESGLGKTLYTDIEVLENKAPNIYRTFKNRLFSSEDAPAYQWYFNGRPIPNSNKKNLVALWEGAYELETTNTSGCTNRSKPYEVKGVAIGEITNPFKVYPNPTAGELKLFLGENIEGQTTITVYRNGGQVAWQEEFASIPDSIDLSSLSAGTYVLECVVAGEKFVTKVIKQ